MFVWSTFNQSYLHSGEAINPEESWPNWEVEEYEWSLGEISITRPEKTYNEMVRCGAIVDGHWVEVDTSVGEDVWVVSVIYSTGDTFGRTNGQGCVVCVCKDLESAKFLEEQIRMGGTPEFLSHAPWSGHFESMTSVDYEQRTVLK